MPPPRQRTQRPTLHPKDEEQLAAVAAELDKATEESQKCTAAVRRVVEDIESDRLSTDGVVLEVFDEQDSLVVHLQAAVRELSSAGG